MRLVVAVMVALHVVAPWMSKEQRRTDAEILVAEFGRRKLPPILGVAIVENESHWHLTLTSGEGLEQSIGLGQVKVKGIAACRKDLASAACQSERRALFTTQGNLRYVALILHANKKMFGAKPERYLAGYQGYAGAVPHRLTHKVMRRWRELERAARSRKRRRVMSVHPIVDAEIAKVASAAFQKVAPK